MPALPLDDAGPYVAAAYLVFVALILVYVAIMAGKLVRIARELTEVAELVERREASLPAGDSSEPDAVDGSSDPGSSGRAEGAVRR